MKVWFGCVVMMVVGGGLQRSVAAAGPDAATTDRHISERAAALLEERYVVHEIGLRYARALRAHARRGDYASIVDMGALADRLTADLQAVWPDGHVRLYRSDPPLAQPEPAAEGADAASGPGTVPGIREMRWLEPEIAYLSFEHFDDRPIAMDAVTHFLAAYAGARALVIDSRANHGGAFDMLGLLANHLFSTSRHLANMDMASAVVREFGSPFPVDGHVLVRTKGPPGMERFEHWAVPARNNRAWFGVPVYYLISKETFSAAEHLAMILKSTRRATLVGETTGGGNHFGGTEPVGGGLELFVPVGHTTDPVTGLDWERTGIAPDVRVAADGALAEALRLLHAAPPDPLMSKAVIPTGPATRVDGCGVCAIARRPQPSRCR